MRAGRVLHEARTPLCHPTPMISLSRVVLPLCLAALLALPASAQTETQCEANDLVVAFSNGMFNEMFDAYQSMLTLKKRMEPLIESDYDAQFVLSYNDSELPLTQVYQVATQRGNDEWGVLLRYIQEGDGPEWLQEVVARLRAESTRQTWVDDGDLQKHVQRYRGAILEGKKVLVASHSQGNFYANAAFYAVDSPSMGIVGAAVPASEIAGSGVYFTLTQDKVMNAVRALYPTTLPANVTNSGVTSSGHEYLADYLFGVPAGRMLMDAYIARIDAIEAPDNDATDGIITVTLEWGSEPDVDLHVFEPNGTHVYYRNRRGTSGFLDVDDTSGFGPEHYYASCEGLLPGTYRVGVNYYRGDAPETARVQVEAGDEVRSFSQPLASDRGSGGNQSPIPVATVVVAGSEEDGFTFSISGGGPAMRDPLSDLLSVKPSAPL